MKKFKTFTLLFIAVLFVAASVFGVMTRKSYKSMDFDLDTAIYRIDDKDSFDEEVDVYISETQIKEELKTSDSIFVVTPLKRDFLCHGSNTVVHVDSVVKGDKSIENNDVMFHEPNSFYELDGKYYYNPMNFVNNLMQIGKSYLIFCNKIEYHPSFQARLDYDEFKPDDFQTLYSFPLDYEKKYLDINKANTYKDIKEYDYICFSEKRSEKLSEIRKDVLEEYLPKK